jgi:rubrerythrin
MRFDSVDEILDYAIGKEEEAERFYNDLAAKMDRQAMKEVFEEFAKEERQHKARLLGVKKGEYLLGSAEKILDLKIGEYLTDVKPSSELTYQQALNLAMKAEKAAYMLYSDLARAADHPDTKQLFQDLAQEEAKHKLRFEVEYDEFFLREN